MIQPSDLRAGNFILTSNGIKEVCGFQKGKHVSAIYFTDGTSLGSHMCSGVQISTEILEKCGFEKQSEHIFISPNLSFRLWGFSWTMQHYIIGVSNWVDITHVSVKYLHQIQNIMYSLTAEELKYNP